MTAHSLAFDDQTWLDPIHLGADPNGLAFDRERDALFVADGRSGAIFRVEDRRHARIATIASAGVAAPNRLGGVAVTPDGTVYVMRLGHGHAGAVLRIEPDGTTAPLAGLASRFWRLGIAYDVREHALYTTQFLKGLAGPFDGGVVRIDLTSGDVSTIVDGFAKPVGVVKLGSTLVVTDSRRRAVYRVELEGSEPATCVPIASSVNRPDSIAACTADSVLLTTYDEAVRIGTVRQLWLDGRSRTIASGEWEPRGVACDGERVFVSARRAGKVLVFRL